MGNKTKSIGKNKSLPKEETFRKAIDGEGHGAVAGNASAKNLNKNGSERLNRFVSQRDGSFVTIGEPSLRY